MKNIVNSNTLLVSSLLVLLLFLLLNNNEVVLSSKVIIDNKDVTDSTTTTTTTTPLHNFLKRNTINDNNNSHHRDLQSIVSGNFLFGIFSTTAFCRQTTSTRYESVYVWNVFAWWTRLTRSDREGTCGKLCSDICDHEPCFNDYSADNELCICKPEVTTSSCGINSECVNDTCQCNKGYSGTDPESIDPNDGACVDIDECAIGNPCGPNGVCSNTIGAYTCSCFDGYEWEGPDGTCVDVNECNLPTPICGSNAQCTNTVGSFTCQRNTGYEGTAPFCTDINECNKTPPVCTLNGVCENIGGSYKCNCNVGFRTTGNPNGGTCIDINECNENIDTCDDTTQVCQNNAGGFTCTCKSGYQETSPGVCTNINECTTSTDPNIPCGPNAVCTDTTGNYTCACAAGFLGGTPPNCRKLNEWEVCPINGDDSACATGLVCATKSRSELEVSACCTNTDRCATNQQCCINGAYTEGQNCPSTSDQDCRGTLVCGRSPTINANYICCRTKILGVCSPI